MMYSERTFCQFFLRRDTRKFTVIWMFANCTHSPIRGRIARRDKRQQNPRTLRIHKASGELAGWQIEERLTRL